MIIGYARSRYEDSVKQQIESLKNAGGEKIYSQADDGIDRGEAVKKLICDVKAGDIVLVTDMNRLSRDYTDAIAITVLLAKKGVFIKCIDNDMDTDSFLALFHIDTSCLTTETK